MLNDGPPLVIAAFRANRMGRNSSAALRAIADLTLLHVIVGASFAGSAIGMFALWDSHRCDRPVNVRRGSFEPRIVEAKGRFRQRHAGAEFASCLFVCAYGRCGGAGRLAALG